MPKTHYLANGIVNHVLRGATGPSLARPLGLYVALFTTPPTASGGGVEVTGAGYSRAPSGAWSDPVQGVSYNLTTIAFPDSSDSWGFLVQFGLFDSVSGGNLLYFGPVASPRVVNAGERYFINPGELSLVEF